MVESESIIAGVIGLGVGERHIEGYRKHPKCRVKAICDFNEVKLREVAARYPELHATTSADEILDDPEINAVSIASYDDAHYSQVVRAIDNGKHIFVEKPLCLYEEQARDIRARLRKRPLVRMSTNLILRLAPRFRRIRNEVSEGLFGEIFYIEGDYNYGRLRKLTEDWRGQLPFYSLVYGGGVHMIDLMMWMTGQNVTRVSAVGNKICSKGTRFRNFDLVSALLTFENGANGKMSVNGGCVQPHFHALKVFGTGATFINTPADGVIYRNRDPSAAPTTVSEAYPGAAKGDLLYNFVESVLTGGALEIDAEEVFRSMSVCFAIEKAVHSEIAVEVEYL